MDHRNKPPPQSYLAHHGIKGQRWGVRRYQNADETWTKAGKERYGDSDDGGEERKAFSSTKKKVAIGVATGAAVIAGTVLTAYLVKKHGAKSVADIVDKAPAGKEIPTPKVEPKQVLEKVVKSASTTAAPVSQISAPRVSVSKPSSEIPPAYSFESLIRQNDDLLKKMLAELA